MAVRPPGDDSSDPDHLEFGIAALSARLDRAEVEFPATSEEICAAVEATEVPYDGAGNTLDLREALRRVPQDEFDSERELLDRLHPVFEERRRTGGNGIVARLRALLPF